MNKFKSLIKRLGVKNTAKKALKAINFSSRLTIKNKQISIPYINGIYCSIDEPWMTEILERLLKFKKGTFVDIGVNVGQTLIQVKSLDENRDYLGFEPNPNCCFYVKELIEKNSLSNCTIIPAGVFEKSGLMKLNLYSEDSTNSGASLIENYREMRSNNKVYDTIYVPVCTFDSVEVILGKKQYEIIKIDVEGAELEVLKSIKDVLTKHKSIVLLEVLPAYNKNNVLRYQRQTDIEELFSDIGYSIYRINKNDKNGFKGIASIDSFGIHEDLSMCDYLIVPQQDKSTIEEICNKA